jgi:hydrogenase/urease accessory protein HupE
VGLPLTIRWPQFCQIEVLPDTRLLDASYVERATLKCSASLEGQVVGLEGIEKTLTDTLIKYTNLAGQVQSDRLTPSSTAITIKSEPDVYEVFVTYLELGVEHIWFGIDHLLFVICLLFIAGTFRRVLVTITGFTIAHSITLISAALGLVTLNPAPVEAVIALSIVFVAREIVLGNKTSVAYRYPVSVAFIFGLLHGFGFAAALGEIGLPYSDKLLALLMFNLGVEVGQVIFISVVILVFSYARKWVDEVQERKLTFFANYGIGVTACYWFLIRLVAI